MIFYSPRLFNFLFDFFYSFLDFPMTPGKSFNAVFQDESIIIVAAQGDL